MNDVDKNIYDDLDLLKNEIKDDLLRELLINELGDTAKEEQEAINQKILNSIKQRYKEDLRNLYEDISELKIEKLAKDFEVEVNKVYSNYIKD
jgi:hypothetical protein